MSTEIQAPPGAAAVPLAGSSTGFLPQDPERVSKFCETLSKSQLVPKDFQGKPSNIFLAIQMGLELGLAPVQSLQSIAVINGRPSLWGDGALALVTSHPDFEDMDETVTGTVKDGDLTARCSIKRKGRSAVVREFTWEDAKLAGLTGKQGPWKQYPKRMIQMRARGFAFRDSFPDALRGLRTSDEAMDIPPEKTIVPDEPAAATKNILHWEQSQQREESLADVVRQNTQAEPEPEPEVTYSVAPPEDVIPDKVNRVLADVEAIPGPEVADELRRRIVGMPIGAEWKDWLADMLNAKMTAEGWA